MKKEACSENSMSQQRQKWSYELQSKEWQRFPVNHQSKGEKRKDPTAVF